MSRSASDLVAAARANIREIAPAETGAFGAAAIIDVREPAEYASGHVPGAINIPRGVIEFQVEAHPALACATDEALALRERPLLLYCLSGGRAALATASLQELGFTRVASIAGGIQGWAAAGLPVHTR